MKGNSPYLNPPPPPRGAGSAEKKRGINPLFAGIVIGMVLGVGLALALALWLNKENNVFVDKTQPVQPLPAQPKSSVPPMSPHTGQTGKPEADKPRFEFYQTLPGEDKDKAGRAATPHTAPPVAPAAAKPAEAGKPVPTYARGVEVKPSTEEYFLQAGAFQNQSEAENMRAKVAFSGFQAQIRNVNVPDKGTLYRVRLGPYKSLDEVNRVKAVLSQGGIAAAIVNNKD
ncbi:MAG: SPOR domain-containing protein [Betaproteobacteria bacterium]|nr:SPOR domain-containing protein [Betaproteobacteria bacterium]